MEGQHSVARSVHHHGCPYVASFVEHDRQGSGAGFVLELAFPELVLVVDGMPVAGGPANDVAEFRVPVGPREAGHEPHEPDRERSRRPFGGDVADQDPPAGGQASLDLAERSEEHTSELQSLAYLVCRLLLEKKKRVTSVPR